MLKIVATTALMVAGGIGTCVVWCITVMLWASLLHGNYMYYAPGNETWVLTAIGFCAPGVVVWYLHKKGTRKEQSR